MRLTERTVLMERMVLIVFIVRKGLCSPKWEIVWPAPLKTAAYATWTMPMGPMGPMRPMGPT